MKLLDLFHGGASGAGGAAQQREGFSSPHPCPTLVSSGAAENKSCPTRPTSNLHGGAEESLAAVGLPHLPHLPHSEIEQNISDAPAPEQIAHARRMLVNCPSTGGELHCWHCSRCEETRGCMAWRTRRADVERFRQCEEPYSLYLVKSGAVEVVQ